MTVRVTNEDETSPWGEARRRGPFNAHSSPEGARSGWTKKSTCSFAQDRGYFHPSSLCARNPPDLPRPRQPHRAHVCILTSPAAAGSSQLLPAREQMAFTLGFHIILVPFGVAFTTLMMMANYRAIRRGDDHALTLAQRWSK